MLYVFLHAGTNLYMIQIIFFKDEFQETNGSNGSMHACV